MPRGRNHAHLAELIGKHLGAFQDKLELSGGPRPISIKISGIR